MGTFSVFPFLLFQILVNTWQLKRASAATRRLPKASTPLPRLLTVSCCVNSGHQRCLRLATGFISRGPPAPSVLAHSLVAVLLTLKMSILMIFVVFALLVSLFVSSTYIRCACSATSKLALRTHLRCCALI